MARKRSKRPARSGAVDVRKVVEKFRDEAARNGAAYDQARSHLDEVTRAVDTIRENTELLDGATTSVVERSDVFRNDLESLVTRVTELVGSFVDDVDGMLRRPLEVVREARRDADQKFSLEFVPSTTSVDEIVRQRDEARREVRELRKALYRTQTELKSALEDPPDWLLRIVRENPYGLTNEEASALYRRVWGWATDAVKAQRIDDQVGGERVEESEKVVS